MDELMDRRNELMGPGQETAIMNYMSRWIDVAGE